MAKPTFNIGSRVIEIDGKGQFAGKKFVIIKDTKNVVNGVSRCRICGKWFSWIDIEPPHCGNSGCEYFWYRRIKHLNKMAKTDTKERDRFFDNPEVVRQILNKTQNPFEKGII